jgi:aquaporin Z
MKNYAAELIGTFTLVFAGTGAIVVNDVSHGTVGHQGIALTFGLIVMAMIYAIGDVSGAHINPAATVAFTVAGRLKPRQAVPYVVSQLIGACLASILLLALFPDHKTLGATLPSGPVSTSFIFEIVLTFILMFVILNVSTGAHEEGITAATAVGGVVALEAMFAGPICGASMNPARSIGPALMSGQTQHLWLYIAAPLIGALLAIPATAVLRPTGSVPEAVED